MVQPRTPLVRIIVLLASVAIACASGRVEAQAEQPDRWGVLDEIIDLMGKHALQAPQIEEATDAAARAVARILGDPYSYYMTPSEYQRTKEWFRGTFGGIGVALALRDGAVVITQVFEGYPGDRAGLKPGDVITHVDEQPVRGLTLERVSKLIRGTPGTRVRLGIERTGPAGTQHLDFVLVRDIIEVPTVFSRILQDDIAYVRITAFYANTPKQLEAVLSKLSTTARGLILDLRDNTGGLLGATLDVCGMFAPGVLVMRAYQADGRPIEYHTGTDYRQWQGPVVALVNGGTASGAEIVAGVLQWYGVATLVGTRTYGKSTMQTLFPLSNGGALRLTTGRFTLASGADLEGEGLTPDVVVPAKAAPALDLPLGLGFQTDRVLRRGLVGLDVLQLQAVLAALGYQPGPADGVFGPKTEKAVRLFQSDHGLAPTGQVDEATAQEIRSALRDLQDVGDVQLETAVQILREMLQDHARGDAQK